MQESCLDQLRVRKKPLLRNETENLGGGRLKIKLTQNKFCVIDLEDYLKVKDFKWSANKAGNTFYAFTTAYLASNKKKNILMHRLLISGDEIDHVDGNGLNNCKSNLRNCTRSQNIMNSIKRINCSSKYKGVSFNKHAKKWGCRIKFSGSCKHIGYFDSEIEASNVYDELAKEYFGEFARLNNATL